MEVIHGIDELRGRVRAWRAAGETVGLVPTMGNLHRGHLHLVEQLKPRAQRRVVSIFVNPTQFGANEDFDGYPRTLEADCAQLAPLGVDAVFAPSVAEMYPDGPVLRTRVEVPELADRLCGLARPGHFVGMATVVSKLFNIVQPDLAAFGMKDYQQLQIIRRMVRDLNTPIEIVPVATVREPDGLALSSRNAYLSAEERQIAPRLAQALTAAAERIRAGERDYRRLEEQVSAELVAAGLRPDYVNVRRQLDLEPASGEDAALVLLAAAWLGRARLIDNLELRLDAPA